MVGERRWQVTQEAGGCGWIRDIVWREKATCWRMIYGGCRRKRNRGYSWLWGLRGRWCPPEMEFRPVQSEMPVRQMRRY